MRERSHLFYSEKFDWDFGHSVYVEQISGKSESLWGKIKATHVHKSINPPQHWLDTHPDLVYVGVGSFLYSCRTNTLKCNQGR